MSRKIWLQCIFITLQYHAFGLQVTSNPPLLNVPTYSLVTRDEGGNTGMNIITYATPVSMRPDRVWSISLYKGTATHDNFSKTGSGILQLLAPCHAEAVTILGGLSSRDTDKRGECEKIGISWIESGISDYPEVLPDCIYYLKIKQIGEMIDCGSHDVAICGVESMFVPDGVDEEKGKSDVYLNTRLLREKGIITEQGRVAMPGL